MNQNQRRTRNGFAKVIVLLVAALLGGIALDAQSAGPRKVEGRLLVKPKPHVAEGQLQALFNAQGAQEQTALKQIDVRIVSVVPARSDAVLDALRHNPSIEFAEQDYLHEPATVPNDTYYSLEWHLPKIGAPAAWDTTVGSNSVIIAILDSGVDGTHPDLSSQLVAGWNLFDGNADTTDVIGHGTGVAGNAAAAGNNGLGVASPAWGCKIMPIRVADTNGYASTSMIADGVNYAADHGARVANVSFRVTGSPTLSAAAQYLQSRGGVVTVSAGNDGAIDPSPDDPYLITVSATDANDAVASFSNTGNSIDVSAPGVNIVTTIRGGGYGYATGTSASAPLVAGVAALMISVNPSLTGAQVRDLIKQSADDLGPPGWDTGYGAGRLRADKAVIAAMQTTGGTNTPPDTTAPTASISSPGAGSTVSDVVTINIFATDDVGVTKVECYMNGVMMGTNSTAPASFSWDTSGYANGSYTLQARAYDAADNMGSSAFTTVTVQNLTPDVIAPTVQITSPTNGTALIGKSMKVYVTASDNVGVTLVRLLVDGKVYASSASASPVFTWQTSKLTRGSHFLQAIAFDAAGNSTRSTAVTVYK